MAAFNREQEYVLAHDMMDPMALVSRRPADALRPLLIQAAWAARLACACRVKRALDVALAVVFLALLAPVMALTALAIRLDSPGPVIFRQTRVGKGGRHFTCYKFRSMHTDAEQRLAELLDRNEADGPVFKLRDDPRVTRVGRVIRRLSIDELPQLWNVLRGEMSLVGPRPALPSEVARYSFEQRRRLSVVPGITGLQQVSGRSDVSFDRWIALDLAYIEQQSLRLDLSILLRTIVVVLLGHGAY
jgi:exopolysaccharide biosynthesis polyprenyl glycosylphosphotransferase